MKLDLCNRAPRRRSAGIMTRVGLFLGCVLLALLVPSASPAQNVINTIAGGGSPLGNGNALTASLENVSGVVKDTAGNVYVSCQNCQYVLKVDTNSQITIIAGTGYEGYGPSGGSAQATGTALGSTASLALDSQGNNLFIADPGSGHVFELNFASKLLTNFAGNTTSANPSNTFGGDGGPATQASLLLPEGVAVSGSTVYIADSLNNRVRVVSPSGTITTFAGNGTACASPPNCGDNGPATQASLNTPYGVAVDALGNVYIADRGDNEIRQVDPAGTITTVAGDGSSCTFQLLPCGDGQPATAAELNLPSAVFVNASGNLYIADQPNDSRIRVVSSGIITSLAGTGPEGFSPDGTPASSALLDGPAGLYVDAVGNVVFAEQGSSRVREIGSDSQTLSTLAGGGTGGDGGPALSAFLVPYDLALDAAGDQFIVDYGTNRIREVGAANQTITTVAGNGIAGYGGDGGAANNANLNYPSGVAVNAAGSKLFIADTFNFLVRFVQNGVISTYAGTPFTPCVPTTGQCGDGGPATQASLALPSSLAVDAADNLFIADYGDYRVRRVDATTMDISTYVGTGVQCSSPTAPCGDGGPATMAELSFPYGLTVDSADNIFIVDGNRVRRVDANTQVITTVAFNGQPTFSGDGGPATLASMSGPLKVAVDPRGDLFIGGGTDEVVRRVDAVTQTVATVAGNAANPVADGFSGDGGPATAATLGNLGLAVNSTDGLYIADLGTNRIRFVQLSPASALSPTTVDFGNQSVGGASSPMPVTLTNTGGDDLLITSITDANEFSQTNNCPIKPNVLAPAQSCTINIVFTPTTAGAANDTLIITDNAPGSPHNIPLSATGSAPFQLTTNCTSLSVVPGQTAIYTVSLTPAQGFTKSVALACGGAPALAQCTVSPNNITLDGATTVQAKVTATTTPATADLLQPHSEQTNRLAGLIGFAGMAGLAGLVILPGSRPSRQARKLWVVLFCLCLISTMATISSCGGGLPPDPPGTAAGTYPLTVTATFQSGSGMAFTEKVSFDLVVQ